ncbi:hypothetical protein ACWGKW_43850 [Streptomyces sp. NPDC054766]
MNVLLFVSAFFCLAVGITAAMSFRMLPWLAGNVSRPRLWGAGYTLFGIVVLYHAVVELVHVDPAVELVMTTITTVTAFAGLGMMWSAQRLGRQARSPHTEPGTTE